MQKFIDGQQKQHQKILVFAISIAVIFHVFAIVFLKNISIDSSSSLQKEMLGKQSKGEEEQEKKSEKIKDAYLAQAFQEIYSGESDPLVKDEFEPTLESVEDFLAFSEEANAESFDFNALEEVEAFNDQSLDRENLLFENTELDASEMVQDQFMARDLAVHDASDISDVFDVIDGLDIGKLASLGNSKGEKRSSNTLGDKNQLGVGDVAKSDDFTVKTSYALRPDKKGYFFRLVMEPKKEVIFKRIKKNLFFLIDRSRSISEERYQKSKEAVFASLALLHEEDTFNIFVFDKDVVPLARESLEVSKNNLEKARDFLKKQPSGGLFASTDLYHSLDRIIPNEVSRDEVNLAILLTDGDTYLPQYKQRKFINQWTQKNQRKVALFCVACGEGNNVPLMELLSAYNKGWSSYCNSYKDLPKLLMQLGKQLQHPIGKNIRIKAFAKDPHVKVTLYPRNARLPDLYDQRPYEIYGSISDRKDFSLFLQGMYYDTWLDLKKEISFDQIVAGKDKKLEKYWNIHRAYDLYDQFFEDGNPEYLYQAKKLLDPFDLPVAFSLKSSINNRRR